MISEEDILNLKAHPVPRTELEVPPGMRTHLCACVRARTHAGTHTHTRTQRGKMEVLIPVFKEVWRDVPLQQSRKLSSFRNSNDNNREPDIKVVRYG